MPNHIHGIIEITTAGADSISAKNTGAEMYSAPTLANTRFGHAEIYRID